MNQATEHVKENKVIYTLLTIVLGAGGIGKLTDNLPVTQGEYAEHVTAYTASSEQVEEIGKKVDILLLQQLKQSLRTVYQDKCLATDPKAIQYIDQEIDDLQDAYETITGRRFQPPPCEAIP
jgi:ATP-dependent protease HslVU (ClpYQ) ATPase subunit